MTLESWWASHKKDLQSEVEGMTRSLDDTTWDLPYTKKREREKKRRGGGGLTHSVVYSRSSI